jgi:ribonuclease HI
VSITIITDGSADNRVGSGGWAAVARTPTTLVELTGWAEKTTSNRMELTAAIEGLRSVQIPSDITIVADSSYLLNTMKRKWYVNWIEQEKLGAVSRPNMDLWYILIGLSQFHNVTWTKVKGHSGDYWNERADRLADLARRDRLVIQHEITEWQPGVRCAELSLSGQQCKLHSNHSCGCYFTNGKANGVEVYGE